MAASAVPQYTEYPVFKGLQRPLEIFGLRGRYIWWAAGALFCGFLAFVILNISVGLLAALVATLVIVGFGFIAIQLKQRKGLHSKKEYKGIFIFHHAVSDHRFRWIDEKVRE